MAKTPGTRRPTLPDDVWARVEPLLVANIGLGRKFMVKDVAVALGLSSPSVSTWINGGGRPNLENLIRCLSFIGANPVELLPEYLGPNLEPWRAIAVADGEDPEDPNVREVYATAYQGAVGATSAYAKSELARRRSVGTKKMLGVRELTEEPATPKRKR